MHIGPSLRMKGLQGGIVDFAEGLIGSFIGLPTSPVLEGLLDGGDEEDDAEGNDGTPTVDWSDSWDLLDGGDGKEEEICIA